MVGYLYQVRVALLLSLRRLPVGTDFLVSVETLDDVTFDSKDGTPQELLQTKHHCNNEATLSDSSTDLWKSLRIWFEAHAASNIAPGTTLHLLTTAQAPDGSAATHLRAAGRNVDAALQALESTAQTSSNKMNEPAYKRFLATPSSTRKAIMSHVIVLDSAPVIDELDKEMRSVVFAAVERKHLDAFLQRLEGWWLRRVLRQLVTPGDRIVADELESQQNDLREQFKQENLPVDEDLLNYTLDEATQATHSSSIFVRQIELTKATRARVLAAVRDYYRAFEQRSRWVREDLFLVGEVSKFEKRLIEEWELSFAAMQDKCGKDAAEGSKELLARDLLEWAEQTAPVQLPIRPRVTEPFVTRGSLHMLADKLQVGWHTDFRARLAALLETMAGTA